MKQRRLLKFEVRIKVLSPVHIGIGSEKIKKNAYHLYNENQSLALLATKKIAPLLVQHYGEDSFHQIQDVLKKGTYPLEIANEIKNGRLALRRIKVHPGAKNLVEKEFKPLIAQATGLPYIPGSSVKGALRTVWLDWQVGQPGRYEPIKRDVAKALQSRRPKSDELLARTQIASKMEGVEKQPIEQNRDLFRAVSVSDLMPERAEKLTSIFAVLPLSYDNDGFIRPAKNGRAKEEAWECLSSQITYTGKLTIDLDLLDSMDSDDQDFNNLKKGLQSLETWREAIARFGKRFYKTEFLHYDWLGDKQDSKGIRLWNDQEEEEKEKYILDWIDSDEIYAERESLFPLGMGVGLLEHSVLGARSQANEMMGNEEFDHGESLIEKVLKRKKYNSEYPIPKSRRVVIDSNKSEKFVKYPLGWTTLTLEEEK